MASVAGRYDSVPLRRAVAGLGLLWMVGFVYRALIFSLPPVLPQVQSELKLSFAFTGSLTSITVFILGAAALPGALLGNRFGAGRLVGFGLLATALGGGVRVLAPGAFWLPAGTALLTVAIAFGQPAISALTRAWFSKAVERASTLYVNGQMIGGLVGFSLTPLLVPGFGWRAALLAWSTLSLLGFAFWMLAAPRDAAQAELPSRLSTLLRERDLWLAAAMLVSQNLTWYTTATFLPFLLRDRGPDYVALVLFLTNVVGLLPTALAALRWSYASSVAFYALAGVFAAGGALLLLLGVGDLAWLAGMGIGLGCSMSYQGVLSIVPRLSRREEDVAGYASIVLTVGFLLTFVGPLSAGALVDLTHSVTASFWPALLSATAMVGLAFGAARFRRPAGAAALAA
jgi:CP family cyanate transporter-like MFS transporter